MTATQSSTGYAETTAETKLEQAPLAHLSIELGHLYMEDFTLGFAHLVEHFGRVAPWSAAAKALTKERWGVKEPRVSTCFLIDDYFARLGDPRDIIDMVMEAAEKAGLSIDYIARESGCAVADGVDLGRLVSERLVADPTPSTNGSRPPTIRTGWLCNGRRSPNAAAAPAMSFGSWAPPEQNAKNRHSIFLDVELWDDRGTERRWSCPFLAAIWQLLRLGLLRYDGRLVARPQEIGDYSDDWSELPAVMRMNPKAEPFSAYRTFSVLDSRFQEIEHATRVILSQVQIHQEVARQIEGRGLGEQVALPRETVNRIEYLFLND
jgi:hypothetical protein